jgi:dipeptidyl aminopeptidase/acylaminoacyl peptidase
MWNNAGTMWHEHQCYLSEGYSVLALNPIGSQGYGEEYSQIITAKWGIDDARDLLLAVDQISDRIDTDRLYTSGGSYAGFQVANLIARDHRFKAAVSQRGVYDLVTFGLNTDIPLFAQWEWQGTPWDKLEYLWEHSPVGRAQDIETPLMIIHSENDFRVAISQAEELFAALKLQDKEAVFVRYPRDGHELSRSGEPLHVIDRLEKMIDWFNSHP